MTEQQYIDAIKGLFTVGILIDVETSSSGWHTGYLDQIGIGENEILLADRIVSPGKEFKGLRIKIEDIKKIQLSTLAKPSF